MPLQELPPGLYDHPLSAAIDQRLARYLRQLSETALAALPEAQRQQQQLALVNRIVALLQQHSPAIGEGDQLHPALACCRSCGPPHCCRTRPPWLGPSSHWPMAPC